jgi:hypothetical protein
MSPNPWGEGCGLSANEYSCVHGALKNFGDLTPYLTHAVYKKEGRRPVSKTMVFDVYSMNKTISRQNWSVTRVNAAS